MWGNSVKLFKRLPNVSQALVNWEQLFNLNKIISEVVNYEVVETKQVVKTKGVWQPFSAQQINTLIEGQRAWSWFQVHTHTNAKFELYDRIEYEGEVYRVMARKDYSKYGYYEYHVIYDYQYVVKDAS